MTSKTDERPRVGPWVKMAAGVLARFDDRGQEVASIDPTCAAYDWWARRPFQEEARGCAREAGEDAARDAADAVLATWADLVDAPQLDALTQARALLRRARLCLGGHPKDGNAASSAHDVQMVDEIDTFLAEDGSGAEPAPRVTPPGLRPLDVATRVS